MNVCECCGAGDADKLETVTVYSDDPGDVHSERWCAVCIDDFAEVTR